MQIKIQNRKLQNFGKICSKFFFLTLFSIIFVFEAKNSFAKNKFFEKSKMAAKMADML